MKKTLLTLAVGCAALVSARDIPVQLERAAIGAAEIPGWTVNKSAKADDYGKGEIVVGSEADEKAFHAIAPAKRTSAYYMIAHTPVKVGEYLEFSADIKGKGTVTFSYYMYDAKGRFLSGVRPDRKVFTLTDRWTEVKFKLKIISSPEGTVGKIRPCFTLSPGTDLLIEDLELEIDDDLF